MFFIKLKRSPPFQLLQFFLMSQWENFWNGASKRDKQDFGISLIVIALAGVFILYFLRSPQTLASPAGPANISSAENLSAIESVVIGDVGYRRYQSNIANPVVEDRRAYEDTDTIIALPDTLQFQDSVNINNTIDDAHMIGNSTVELDGSIQTDTLQVDSIDGVGEIPEVDSLGTGLENIGELEDAASDLSEESKNNASEQAETGSEVENTENEVDNSSPVETKPSTSANKPDAKPRTDCIIIVGSYGELKNAITMQDRLKDAGYDTFRSPKDELIRVGVFSSCSATILENTLATIKKDFAPDAVILKRE